MKVEIMVKRMIESCVIFHEAKAKQSESRMIPLLICSIRSGYFNIHAIRKDHSGPRTV